MVATYILLARMVIFGICIISLGTLICYINYLKQRLKYEETFARFARSCQRF